MKNVLSIPGCDGGYRISDEVWTLLQMNRWIVFTLNDRGLSCAPTSIHSRERQPITGLIHTILAQRYEN